MQQSDQSEISLPSDGINFFCQSRGTSESSTYGKQRICPPTLGQHISTFRGYWILFSIRNPYINRFTNHFSIHSQPSYPQKVVLHSITARFSLRPYDFVISHPFWNICHVTSRKLRNRQTSGESASLPQYLGCNKVFDMRLRVTFLRRKTVSLQSNIAHRE